MAGISGGYARLLVAVPIWREELHGLTIGFGKWRGGGARNASGRRGGAALPVVRVSWQAAAERRYCASGKSGSSAVTASSSTG